MHGRVAYSRCAFTYTGAYKCGPFASPSIVSPSQLRLDRRLALHHLKRLVDVVALRWTSKVVFTSLPRPHLLVY